MEMFDDLLKNNPKQAQNSNADKEQQQAMTTNFAVPINNYYEKNDSPPRQDEFVQDDLDNTCFYEDDLLSIDIMPPEEIVEQEVVQQEEQVVEVHHDQQTLQLLTSMNTKLDKMEVNLFSQSLIEKQQQQIIDTLHSELMSYKENAYKDQLVPFIKGIIAIINNQFKRIRELKKQTNGLDSTKIVIEELETLIEDLENLLYPYEVDSINVKPGQKFDVNIHKVITKVITTDKAKDRIVADVVGKGYKWGSRVIEKTAITIYVYDRAENGGTK